MAEDKLQKGVPAMVTVASFVSTATPTTSTTSTTKVASSSTTKSTTATASTGPTTRDAGAASGIKVQFAADKPRTADSLREQLRGKMDEALSGIYKDKDQRAKATDESLKSLAPQIEKAAANKSVTGVEIRVGSLDTKYGSSASVRGIAVEVGFVKDKKVSSADTTVMDYQGK